MPRKFQFKQTLDLNKFSNYRLILVTAIWLIGSWVFFQFLMGITAILEIMNLQFGFWFAEFYLRSNFSLENPIRTFALAWFSCVWAQIWAVNILFSKRNIQNFHHGLIQNDIQFLSLSFIATGAKFFLIFSFVFLSLGTIETGLEGIVNWILILSILVLFFQNWLTIRRKFQRTLKPMLYTFLIYSILSLLFTQNVLIDSEKQKNILLNKRTENKLEIDIPKLNFESDLLFRKPLCFPLYIGKNQENNSWEVWDLYRKIGIDGIKNHVFNYRNKIPENQHYRAICVLIIDKNAPLYFIDEVKCKLANSYDQHKLFYQIEFHKENIEKLIHIGIGSGIYDRIPIRCIKGTELYEILPLPDLPPSDTIFITETNRIFLNNYPISEQELSQKVYTDISTKGGQQLYYLAFHPKATYEKYIKAKIALKNGYNQFRNEKALVLFGEKNSYRLSILQEKEIRNYGSLTIEELLTN